MPKITAEAVRKELKVALRDMLEAQKSAREAVEQELGRHLSKLCGAEVTARVVVNVEPEDGRLFDVRVAVKEEQVWQL